MTSHIEGCHEACIKCGATLPEYIEGTFITLEPFWQLLAVQRHVETQLKYCSPKSIDVQQMWSTVEFLALDRCTSCACDRYTGFMMNV